MSVFQCGVLAYARQCPRRSVSRLFLRQFRRSSRMDVVKPFLLADIGEGITECQLIQWFVQPGARVEQFDKLCEVQSDKASVEITSPFDGVIRKLHYGPDDMAITGKPLVDIDIQGELSEEDQEKLGSETPAVEESTSEIDASTQNENQQTSEETVLNPRAARTPGPDPSTHHIKDAAGPWLQRGAGRATLATPAVRRITKEFNVDIADVRGSGRDGRVLKEDVHRHVSEREGDSSTLRVESAFPQDRKVKLSPVQSTMFKVMTRSLNIPHFLYSCSTDMKAITELRTRLNASLAPGSRITHFAFIIKAVSFAFLRHPMLNSTLDTKDPTKPELTYKGSHNFGIAIDSSAGLVVPVLRNVQDLSISEIASEIRRLSKAARENRLDPSDFNGASFTVSNIGSVGGGVVAPVISEPQVAILGVGRSKVVPAFDEAGNLTKKEELILSWSADHRVVDGAECARCAEGVKTLLEDPSRMIVDLR